MTIYLEGSAIEQAGLNLQSKEQSMKQPTLFITTFTITLALCAGFAWLCGYDFGTRNSGVAVGSALAIIASVITGILAVTFHGL